MRNCRIWCVTTIFLDSLLAVKLLALIVFGDIERHVVDLAFLGGEITLRIIGLVFINKFVKELSTQFTDGDVDEGMDYEQLCPSPAPQLKSSLVTSHHHV